MHSSNRGSFGSSSVQLAASCGPYSQTGTYGTIVYSASRLHLPYLATKANGHFLQPTFFSGGVLAMTKTIISTCQRSSSAGCSFGDVRQDL